MHKPTGENLLIGLKKEFEALPTEVRKQLIAVLDEFRKVTERAEPQSVAFYDRSTHSWFAKA